MMMMKWIKGEHANAAKVDPAVATALAIVVEVIIRFDLHTKMGISPEVLLMTLLDIAAVAMILRSIQTNSRKKPEAPAANDTPPTPTHPAEDEAA